MITEIKLGLCNPPEPIYLYVKNSELGGESYLWYRYDINNEKTIPVQERGLAGYLTEMKLTTKEFKGNHNTKLDIVISADEIYVIRTGVETNFAKTFLLAASLVPNFSKPLIIAATAGEENVVFCQLYDAINKTKFRADWDKNADWASIIDSLQSRLTGKQSEDFAPSITKQQSKTTVHSQDMRVKQVRTLLDYPVDLVKEWLQFQDVKFPSNLEPEKVDELVKNMCIAWAADKVDHPNFAANSYQKYVLDAIAQGVDEVAAIQGWMKHIAEQRAVASLLTK
jgi:hypothetical protein